MEVELRFQQLDLMLDCQVRVAPGEHLRLRVLDFPLAEPPMRRWQLERGESGFP